MHYFYHFQAILQTVVQKKHFTRTIYTFRKQFELIKKSQYHTSLNSFFLKNMKLVKYKSPDNPKLIHLYLPVSKHSQTLGQQVE